MNARTRAMLEGPVTRTLIMLAAPNVLVMALQAAMATLDAVYVGWLGKDELAGVSLVFPLLMLMQTMSAGGMGGGVASAVARALGAGRRDEAGAVVVHAVVIALAMAAVFTSGLVLGGPALYRLMGGEGAALAAAVAYSHVVFGAAVAYWLFNTLASAVRGSGVMGLPAVVMAAGAAMYAALAPALVVGWGPFPRLGVAGAAAANVTWVGLGALVLAGYLAAGRGVLRPARSALRLRWAVFREILRVGAPGALNTVMTNLAIAVVTALVAPFGVASLAGYGVGARLEYLQIPLVFGMGSALVTMVGTNVGAGRRARAERVAWTGAAIAAAFTGGIGLAAALWPSAWIGLFTSDPAVLGAGATYLRIVGPTYGFFGLGLALYFASQGAGRLGWPLTAGALRLLIAGAGGYVASRVLGLGLPGLYGAMALALVVLGGTLALAIRAGAWRR